MPTSLSETRLQITRDWARAFPELGVYRPLWLARRLGPVVQGVCLDRNAANDAYAPTPHLHCLASASPAIGLTPGARVVDPRSGAELWVRAGLHERDREEAARLTRAQSVLPFGPLPAPDEIADAYRGFVRAGPIRWDMHPELREDMASVLAWFGRQAEAESALREAAREMARWRAEFLPEGGPQAWLAREVERVHDVQGLRGLVERRLREMGLKRVPSPLV